MSLIPSFCKSIERFLLLFLFLVFFAFPKELSSNSYELDALDSITKKEKNYNSKSATGAIIRSLVLPGWGQIYVENHWKAPIFFGAAAGLTYLIIWNNNQFIEKKNLFNQTEAENPNDPMLPVLKNSREFYRDNRDRSAFFLAGVYILAAVDSYVGAHLFDFDVGDDLSLKISSNVERGAIFTLSLKIK